MKKTNFDQYLEDQLKDPDFSARFERADETLDIEMYLKRSNLRQLAAQIVALQEQARLLGLFPGDRDLLECPNCGLLEDVTFTGQLITWYPSAEGQDTGFRFEELSQDHFRCPACGTIVQLD